MMLFDTALQCPLCGRDGLSQDDFYGRERRCKECARASAMKWRKRNLEQYKLNQHRARLLRDYGITLADYEAMFDAQGGVCAGCGNPCSSGRRLSVDHDHATGKVRGLLCLGCNHVLGIARDKPETLRRLATYLEDSK